MFRSSERRLVGALVAVLLALAALTAGPEPWTVMAVAAPAPTPPGGATRLPVLAMTAPVLDLLSTTSDVDGRAISEETPGGARFPLDSTLLFGRDSARLRPGARQRLARVAAELRRQRPGRLRIVGYTDDLGSAAHGVVLSRRRAAAVRAALRSSLPADRYPVTVAGRGEANPVVPNTSEANRRRNRRVVLTFRDR